MFNLQINTDPVTQGKAAAGAVAMASSAATAWLSLARGVVLDLLGVPLAVVLAAATGAYGARSFTRSEGIARTLWGGALWTAAGVFGARLALWLAGRYVPGEAPEGALAGAALVLSALGQLLAPVVAQKLPVMVGRILDGIGRDGTGQDKEGGHE